MISRKRKKVAFVVAFSVFCLLAAMAQVRDTTLERSTEEVTVSARRVPRQLTSTVPVQAISAEKIHALGLQNMADAVRRFAGTTVRDYGGIGGMKTVSVRSLGAHHTAISYDGVAVSDVQSGQVDIGRFNLDNVDMVSLSIGQSDDIFQTARMYASAGVVHIKTQRPVFADNSSFNLSMRLKGGSFGLFNPNVLYEQKIGNRLKTSLLVDYMCADSKYPFILTNGRLKIHEKRQNSDVVTFRIEGNVYHTFGTKGGKLDTKLYMFRSERGLPGSVTFYNNKATERLWNDNSFVQTHYSNKLSEKISLQAIVKYAYAFSKYRDENDKYAQGFQEDRNTQHEYYTSAGAFYEPFRFLSASLTTDFSHTTLRNNFVNFVQPSRNTSLTALALCYKNNVLTVIGSLLNTYMSDKVENGEKPDDRKRLSPALSLSWQPFGNRAFRLRTSYKDIFRVPTFTDLYYLRMGNTNLRPEKTKQLNVGMTWSKGFGHIFRNITLSVDGYYNKVEDKIVAIPTLYIWKMMNMDQVDIKGLDASLSADFPLIEKVNVNLAGSYTYQYAIDITDSESKNYKHQIPYTPRHTGNASASFFMPWLNVSYLLMFVGDRYALPQNKKENKIDRYIEQSISMNRTFKFKKLSLRLQAEVLNIADAQYDVIQYYPMPGRSWRASITLIL